MKNMLQPVIRTAESTASLVSAVSQRVEEKYANRPGDAILEDVLRSTVNATAYLLMATTGKNVHSLGLQDRSVRPWARKAAVVLAVREAASAGLSGRVLWLRHREAARILRMMRAYQEDEDYNYI